MAPTACALSSSIPTCTRRSGRRRRQSGWLRRARSRLRSRLGAAQLRPTSRRTAPSRGAGHCRVRVEPRPIAATPSSAQHPSRSLSRRSSPLRRARARPTGAALTYEAVADGAHRAARAAARGVHQAQHEAGEVRCAAPRRTSHDALRTHNPFNPAPDAPRLHCSHAAQHDQGAARGAQASRGLPVASRPVDRVRLWEALEPGSSTFTLASRCSWQCGSVVSARAEGLRRGSQHVGPTRSPVR